MSASDVFAIVAATTITILVAVLATLLVVFARALRELRATVDVLRADALALLDETEHAVSDAAAEVHRVDRLVSSAERLDEAKRAIATPVVKAMAFGSGVSRAAQRMREGEPPARASAARRRRRNRAS
jgi:hypothetical protein